MMAQKHLHELLEEDQEPFHLNSYIAEKRFNLRRISPKSHLQVRRRKPISATSVFPGNFCKNACFSSFQPSPDTRKSPLFEFRSPARNSPCKSPNAFFLQIPARTAALLLEAALKIHKQKSSSRNKSAQIKNQGFALFGSVLKRLTHRNRNTNRETETRGIGRRKSQNEIGSCNRRSSYGFWSESNEERSMDLGTSCSSQSEDSEEASFAYFGEKFCESPFRFVLQRSPSHGCRTPDFLSPARSPNLCNKQETTIDGAESLKKFQVEEDEEDKEQCSPVSVLDTPFDDGYDDGYDDEHYDRDDEHNDRDGVEDGDGDYNLECSYATVQRTKQQLLNKLCRFERLADLDPIELEKVMSDEEEDEKDYDEFDNEEYEDDIGRFIEDVMADSRQIPKDMRKLVADLVAEEEADQSHYNDQDEVVRQVCKRMELWKEVEFNTIDMMVEEDLRKEVDEWRKNQEQRGEAAMDVELAIFSLLVEELAMELSCSNAD